MQSIAQFPWILTPGVFIFLTIMAFNFLGDYLRDTLDPRSVGVGGMTRARPTPLLEVRDLHTHFETEEGVGTRGRRRELHGVDRGGRSASSASRDAARA